jgi:hypothetical protein
MSQDGALGYYYTCADRSFLLRRHFLSRCHVMIAHHHVSEQPEKR